MHVTAEQAPRRTRGRERNRTRIVDALRGHGSASRSELARTTGLSRATVSSVVADLEAHGLVTAGGPDRARAIGRPPKLLRLHPTAGAALALRMEARSVDIAVSDLSSTLLAERRIPLPAGGDLAAELESVADGVDGALAQAGVDRTTIRGATIVVARSHPAAVAAAISGRLGFPVRVEDEANMGALGELRHGVAQGLDDLVYVHLSSSVTAGLVLGGRLHRGAGGVAGGLGHVQVIPEGALCRCGNRGCLDTVASLGAVLGTLSHVHGELDLPELLELLARNDAGTRRVVADAGRALGRVLAAVCTTLNPQAIVLGGELAASGAPLVAGIREAIDRHAQPDTASLVAVRAGTLGRRAALHGALSAAVVG